MSFSLPRLTQQSLGIVSFFTNSLLALLIAFKSPPSLNSSYKWLMIYQILLDAGSSVIQFFLVAELEEMESGFFLIGPLLAIWFGCVCASLINLITSFVFRFMVAIGDNKWTCLKNLKALVWIVPSMSIGIVWTTSMLLFRSKKVQQPSSWFNSSAKWYHNNNVILSLVNEVTIPLFITLGVVSAYTSWRVIVKLPINPRAEASVKHKAIQYQCFFALLFQSAFLIALILTPIWLFVLAALFEFSCPICSSIVQVIVSLHPTIAPLMTIVIIQTYRDAINIVSIIKTRRDRMKVTTSFATQPMGTEVISLEMALSEEPRFARLSITSLGSTSI